MAKIRHGVVVDYQATLVLNESELRALDALVGYGFKPFIEAFYSTLGEAYMKPHASGLESLFARIREDVPSALSAIDEANKALAVLGKPLSQKKIMD